jgi:hypothetical protein
VAPDGAAALLRRDAGPAVVDPTALPWAACGPPLHLALAAQGRYCLHAGAVFQGDRAVALLGDSGAGKSTLAEGLAVDGWQRLADDILPLATEGGAVLARPDYPHVRLRPADWPSPSAPPPRLVALWVVDVPADPASPVSLDPLSPAATALAVVRHTVAARLLAGELAERHLSWCAAVARLVPGWRLSYPHRLDAVVEVARLLTGSTRMR